MSDRIPLLLYHDVLCAYCWAAERRLHRVIQDLGGAVELRLAPYPLRDEQVTLGKKELSRIARATRAAGREPELDGISAQVWKSESPPRTSLPALLASEAALEFGRNAQGALVERLRTAAFYGGLDISRRDVILEAAASLEVPLPAFTRAFDARRTARSLERQHREALGRGVRAVPALAIGDRWLMTGLRRADEYQEAICNALDRGLGGGLRSTLH